MYADDTVIYTHINRKLDPKIFDNFQHDLDCISQWCFTNRLSINAQKTQVMYLGASQRIIQRLLLPTFSMKGTPLTTTLKYKYLGLTLTPELTFEEHTRKSFGLVTAKVNSLAHLRNYVGVATSLQIYKTTILP